MVTKHEMKSQTLLVSIKAYKYSQLKVLCHNCSLTLLHTHTKKKEKRKKKKEPLKNCPLKCRIWILGINGKVGFVDALFESGNSDVTFSVLVPSLGLFPF